MALDLTRKRETQRIDRFLQERQGNYYYKRRVPLEVADIDERAPHVRVSLKTDDIAVARVKRDAMEQADNELWGSLLGGSEKDVAQRQYDAAVKRAQAYGFTYKTVSDLAREGMITDIIRRFNVLGFEKTPPALAAAVLGGVERPKASVSEAFDIGVPSTWRSK